MIAVLFGEPSQTRHARKHQVMDEVLAMLPEGFPREAAADPQLVAASHRFATLVSQLQVTSRVDQGGEVPA